MNTDDVVTRLFRAGCGHSAINATAHGNQNFHPLSVERNPLSGVCGLGETRRGGPFHHVGKHSNHRIDIGWRGLVAEAKPQSAPRDIGI